MVLYFVRNKGEERKVWVGKEYGVPYYQINHGKYHYENPKKYIAKMMEKGWRKVTLREYFKTKVRWDLGKEVS